MDTYVGLSDLLLYGWLFILLSSARLCSRLEEQKGISFQEFKETIYIYLCFLHLFRLEKHCRHAAVISFRVSHNPCPMQGRAKDFSWRPICFLTVTWAPRNLPGALRKYRTWWPATDELLFVGIKTDDFVRMSDMLARSPSAYRSSWRIYVHFDCLTLLV